MEAALRRTLIGMVALAVLAAGLAVSASQASAAKYRGRMVEAPPGAPQVKERLSFEVVTKGKRAKRGSQDQGALEKIERVMRFRFGRLAGTECTVSNDVSFPFEDLVLGLTPSTEFRKYDAKVKPNGRFRLNYSFPVLILGPPIDQPETVGVRAPQSGPRAGASLSMPNITTKCDLRVDGWLGPNTARGTASLSLVEADGDEVICDSFGKRRWKAKRVRR